MVVRWGNYYTIFLATSRQHRKLIGFVCSIIINNKMGNIINSDMMIVPFGSSSTFLGPFWFLAKNLTFGTGIYTDHCNH